MTARPAAYKPLPRKHSRSAGTPKLNTVVTVRIEAGETIIDRPTATIQAWITLGSDMPRMEGVSIGARMAKSAIG